MNVVITLPDYLIEKIRKGEKSFILRKSCPRYLRCSPEGFFIVQKGTTDVVCFCSVYIMFHCNLRIINIERLVQYLCVDESFINNYLNGKIGYLWQIERSYFFDTPIPLNKILPSNKAPQNFSYTVKTISEFI